MAGFRGPLFLLGISAGAKKAGFRGALPIPFLGGTEEVTQAGFRGVLPIPFLGAGIALVVEPEGGPSGGAVRQTLHDDDEVIIMVARAFLTMVN